MIPVYNITRYKYGLLYNKEFTGSQDTTSIVTEFCKIR